MANFDWNAEPLTVTDFLLPTILMLTTRPP